MCLAMVYHITIKFPCEEEKKDTNQFAAERYIIQTLIWLLSKEK